MIEEAENDLVRDQDDDYEYNLADDAQVDENNVDAKSQAGRLVNGFIDINAIED